MSRFSPVTNVLASGNQVFTDQRTFRLRADGLAAGQRVERPRLAGPRDAAQAGAAVSRVDPAGVSFLQRAGRAASAARLSQDLRTVRGHGGTGGELLL